MKKLKGFTLVEMLVVMGILIILMTMGIAAGRFAIQRANRVQHQNAADQLYQGLQAYYADNREYPSDDPNDSNYFGSWQAALGTGGVIQPYVDSNSFDGGSDASFYYAVDTNGQSALICVTFGGLDDEQDLGGYCNGNGFGVLPANGSTKVSQKDMEADDFNTLVHSVAGGGIGNFIKSDWSGNASSWQ